MGRTSVSVVAAALLAFLVMQPSTTRGADWTIIGTILGPTGILPDGAISISNGVINRVGPSATIPSAATGLKVPGIILPGFIDLHDHLTWNVLPRWKPGRKFNNRYEWQDTQEYRRVLQAPHTAIMKTVACEIEIYAEIKALAGGATSVVGGLLKDPKYPDNETCVKGLARNLDTDSGLTFTPPSPNDHCPTTTDRNLRDVVENEVFPMELTHDRMDFLLCELSTGTLHSMLIHLSEGSVTDASAHYEFTMVDREKLLTNGLAIIHGTALRDQDFANMRQGKVGLIWSPRSNDELYGSTTNIAAARQAGVDIAIAPDWSPSGSAGMLQELGYAARRYGSSSDELIAMATSVPAKIARISNYLGTLEAGKKADFIVIDTKIDPRQAKPLDPVVNATPANVALVVVGGEPLYGDRALLAQSLPAGTKLDAIMVCGVEKAVFLGQSGAAAKGKDLNTILSAISTALIKEGLRMAEIECD